MKKAFILTVVLLLLAALFTGCAGTYYEDGYRGNVSTTDDGYVNGTNDWLDGSYAVGSDPDRMHRASGSNSTGGSTYSPYAEYSTNGRSSTGSSTGTNRNTGSSTKTNGSTRSSGRTSGRSVPNATVPSQMR